MDLMSMLSEDKELHKPLSKSELYSKLRDKMNGDMDARNEVISRNIRFVLHVVKKRFSWYYNYDDVVANGIIGLIKAVDKYDVDGSMSFLNYAEVYIRYEILAYFKNERKYNKNVSMEEDYYDNRTMESVRIADLLEDTTNQYLELEEEYERDMINNKIHVLIEELPEREKFIVKKKFGFDSMPMKQMDIAKEMGCTDPVVSKLKKSALTSIEEELNTFDPSIKVLRKGKRRTY